MSLRRIAHSSEEIIISVSRIFNIVGIGFLVIIMLLTVADVFLRYFLNSPIQGSLELTEYFMVIVVFFGVAWCGVRGGHVRVDLVVNRFSPRAQAIFDSITCLLSLTILPLIVWRSVVESNYVRAIPTLSDVLKIPAYPFLLVTAIGCAIFTLVLLTNLVQFISRAVKG